jgi:hypothetical protein
VGGVPARCPDCLRGEAGTFFFGVVRDRRNDHSDSNWTDSNSEESGEWSRRAGSIKVSMRFSATLIMNTRFDMIMSENESKRSRRRTKPKIALITSSKREWIEISSHISTTSRSHRSKCSNRVTLYNQNARNDRSLGLACQKTRYELESTREPKGIHT